ncbi:ATP-binding protein [Archangium sp.]|uniref:ATP-binding protein n=1 Tax=Archangium sp. TaxID=1872627 RepID=UPI002D2B822A|nr:ATP-binding protein [Archangium sp.]HYO54127.1 ATP-binding protein [Archangium sp.]
MPDGTGGAPYQHLETLPFALAVVRDSRTVYVSPALLRLLGISREEVTGRSFEFFSEQHRPFLAERHARRLRGEPVPDRYETVLCTSTGERRVELSISMNGSDTWLLVRDLTGRVAHRQLLQRVASLGASLPGLHAEEEVLRRVFEGLAELELTYGYLVPEGERVWLGHAFVATGTAAGEARLTGQHLVDVPGNWTPMLRLAWGEGSAYGEDFTRETTHFVGRDWAEPVRTHLRRVGPLRSICVRIELEGKPRALLAVAADWLSEEELPPLRLFAAQVSAALEAARTISRLSTHNTALTALSQLAAVAATALEPRAFFGPGTEEIIGLLRCAAVLILLRTEDSDELELVWHQGATEESVRPYRRIPIRGTMSGKVIELGTPLMLQADDFPEPIREDMRRHGRASVAMVPLQVRSLMVGTLVVTFSQHRLLSTLELETLQAMGAHFAAAIESHRLLQEVKRTQRQLVEHERLAALGELSAVVAHEVRNPLGAIFNAVATLRRFVKPVASAHTLVSILEEEANRLNRIVDDLLDFARPSSPQFHPVPLARLLEEAVRTAVSGQSRIRLEWALEPDVPPVPVDERMMRQAFLNLALNAVQAMPSGGTLRVAAHRCPKRPGAVVEFTDTGPGIPPELRERLFTPFFTTKATGTGLGLAIVQRTLDVHGGHILIESPPGGGTTFRLALPLGPEPVEASAG